MKKGTNMVITTRSGRILCYGSEAPVDLACAEKCPAKNIKPGHFIKIKRSTEVTPFSMDLDYYAYGYLVGDGCYSYKGYRIDISVLKDCNVVPQLVAFLQKHGAAVRTYQKKNERAISLSVENKKLREELFSVGLGRCTATDKGPPLVTSLAQKASFLRGLFDSDGSCDSKRALVRLVSVSEKLIGSVAELLLDFGIVAVWSRRKTYGENHNPSHVLTIQGEGCLLYQKQIGFSIDYKAARLAEVTLLVKGKTGIDFLPECFGIKRDFMFLTAGTEGGTPRLATYGGESGRTVYHILRGKYVSYPQLVLLKKQLTHLGLEIPASWDLLEKEHWYYDEVKKVHEQE